MVSYQKELHRNYNEAWRLFMDNLAITCENINDPVERIRKTENLISRFPAGRHMYKKSVLFNKSIKFLLNGGSTYELIEQLILTAEGAQRALEDYLHKPHNL